MGGPQIDHDRFFKELLSTFFIEFLDLFFPKLAATVNRDSLEFLNQELYVNQLDGEQYRADLIVKARWLNQPGDSFFLIHVEHQSTAPANFGRRFFRYYSAIFEKHGAAIYPIVVYSHDAPRKKQPDTFTIDFPDSQVLRFRYHVVQLNRLSWRRFVNAPNPIASALMSKMRIAPRDRPRVKLECLRLLVTLKLNPAKAKLISKFLDAYLRLDPSERERFRKAMDNSQLTQEQTVTLSEYVTSWEQDGIEKGLQRGLQQGVQQGLQALREVLVDILTTRFGPVDPLLLDRIQRVESIDDLRRLTHEALTIPSIAELPSV